jgi:hypothetical protein
MIRKLLIPALAVAALSGCMTSGYNYRQDRGDYYYGQPGTDYRYHGSPYGSYDGYYGSGYYSRYYGYPGYYRYPYGYYGRYPYGYYRPPVVIRPGHGDGGGHHDRDDGKAPWRDIGRLQRERIERGTPVVPQRAPRPATSVRPSAPPRASRDGSRMQQIMKRARSGAVDRQREADR